MPKCPYNEYQFWQQKYKNTCCEQYEWICKPNIFINAISEHIDYTSIKNVLEVGCGTSSLSVQLKKQLQSNGAVCSFTLVDFSKQMTKKLKNSKLTAGMNICCADVRNLGAISQKFDLILDKGCLDCLFCFDNFTRQVIIGLRELYRTLNPGGKLIVGSIGSAKHRVYLLRNKLVPFDQVKVITIPKNKDNPGFNLFICSKGEDQNNIEQDDNQGAIDPDGQKSQPDINIQENQDNNENDSPTQPKNAKQINDQEGVEVEQGEQEEQQEGQKQIGEQQEGQQQVEQAQYDNQFDEV